MRKTFTAGHPVENQFTTLQTENALLNTESGSEISRDRADWMEVYRNNTTSALDASETDRVGRGYARQ